MNCKVLRFACPSSSRGVVVNAWKKCSTLSRSLQIFWPRAGKNSRQQTQQPQLCFRLRTAAEPAIYIAGSRHNSPGCVLGWELLQSLRYIYRPQGQGSQSGSMGVAWFTKGATRTRFCPPIFSLAELTQPGPWYPCRIIFEFGLDFAEIFKSVSSNIFPPLSLKNLNHREISSKPSTSA